MKKVISLILTVIIFTAALAAPSYAATSDGVHGYVPCDCNDDGVVNMKDVLLLRRLVGGAAEAKDVDLLAADCNGDGAVNMKDVLYLRRVIAGDEEPEANNADGKYRVGAVSFGGRNISRYDILIPEDADECMKHSSGVLQKKISAACGIKLNIIDDRADAHGYVIEYGYDNADEYGLGADGYRVTVDGDVTMVCGAPRGALYATYYFLEKFVGYRFLDNSVEYLYEADRVDTPDGFDDVEVPKFVYRAVSDTAMKEDDFAVLRLNAVDGNGSHYCADRRYGGGVGNLYIHGHSYEYQEAVGMKLDEYRITDLDSEEAKEVYRTYAYNTPEHIALAEQYRLAATQPCLTSDVTFRHIMALNYMLYKERTERGGEAGVHFTTICCSPNDNTAFCTCPDCKAIYEEEGSIAGTVFRLSNRVAAAQRELIPGVGVYTIAYWDARKPPKYTRPEDDVTVCFCIGGCNNHTYDRVDECEAAGGNRRLPNTAWDGSTTPSSNVDDIAYFLEWSELTDNLHIWYYSCSYGYFATPAPNVFNIYNDIKFVADSGASGVYFEGGGGLYSFEYLKDYLASRMLWDPEMSEEEFEGYLDEFLMIYYGGGWENIKEYLYIADRTGDLKGCWTNNFDWAWDMYDKDYFASQYARVCQLFDGAIAEAGSGECRERVEGLAVHAHFLGLSATYERDFVNGDASAREEYSRRYEWLYRYFDERGYLEGVRDDGYRAAVFSKGRGGMDNMPKSPSDIRDTMTWILPGYTGERS